MTVYLYLNDFPPLEIVNLYAPSQPAERLDSFKIFSFPHQPHHVSILAGDFNDCPSITIDRKNQSSAHHWEVLESKFPVKLCDTVRLRHPSRALFTRPHFVDNKLKSCSRIDHILLSDRHKSYLRDAHIRFDAPHSDHRPVVARLDLPATLAQIDSLPSTSHLTTRVNPSVFRNPDFAARFSLFYSESLRPQLSFLPADARWEASKQKIVDFASLWSRERYRTRRKEQVRLEEEIASLETSALDLTTNARWLALRDRLRALEAERTSTLFLRTGLPFYPNDSFTAVALHRKLAARKSSSTFTNLKLADGSTTTDISTALSLAHEKFSTHFTPSPRSPSDVENARSHFLSFIRSSSSSTDPRFARRWDPAASAQLDRPISVDEVKRAILDSPSSSSPGLLGLPYEFYKQNSTLLASDLAAAFNRAWERGSLPPSQMEARVRLLFKYTKPNADPSLLAHYRPISLRETDYRLLARILVARINPLLVNSIPRSQIGFVPGRDSSEAGLHLQLLVEEIQHHDLPGAALLSLDQESAYDLLDHRWILACYETFGAPPRFLQLLSAVYDSSALRARYNINGFFTEPVSLRCGLPQGCPLSCASWLLSFQPFLDALVRRRIALTLPSLIDQTRADIVTSLAFADDSIAIVENLSSALPNLRILADDWKLATNGRLNPSKTVATAIGSEAKKDPLASETTWTELEDFAVWAGFPISLKPQPPSFYALLLEKMQRKSTSAAQLYSTPRTRAIFANTHILSLALHSLSFYPAPQDFLTSFRRILLDFVWNGTTHSLDMKVVFLPAKEGGLGLIDPFDVDKANNLRRLDLLLARADPLWHDLAVASWSRTGKLTKNSLAPSPWGLFRSSSLYKLPPFWSSLASVAIHGHIRIHPEVPTTELLSFPPSLFCEDPSLSLLFSISELYADKSGSYFTLPPPSPSPPRSNSSRSSANARLVWAKFTSEVDFLSHHFPTPTPRITLPLPSTPTPAHFTLLDLNHGFSTAEARSALLSSRPRLLVPSVFVLLTGSPPEEEDLARIWTWIYTSPATPREAETHWRALHRRIPTRSRQKESKSIDDDSCVFCPPPSRDTVEHALFLCSYSSAYWEAILTHLHENVDLRFTSETFTPAQILLGLPLLRSRLDDRAKPYLRALVAVAVRSLVDIRWKRIKLKDPTLSSPTPLELADKALDEVVRRVP